MKSHVLTLVVLLALGCASSSGSSAVVMELAHITEGDPPLGTVLRVRSDGRIVIEKVGGRRGLRTCGQLSDDLMVELESHLESWMATEQEVLPGGSWHAERYQVAFDSRHRTALKAKMPSALLAIKGVLKHSLTGCDQRLIEPFL